MVIPPKDELAREADALISFVETCTRPDGLLAEWVDPKTRRVSPAHLLGDFGDWAPFFLARNHPALVEQHLRALPHYLDKNGILLANKSRFGIPWVTAFEHTDLLLGLLDCSERFPEAKVLAQKMLAACKHTFGLSAGKVHSYYLHWLGTTLPVASSVDATFIELFVQASATLGDPSLLDDATALAHYFADLPFRTKHHLFPELSGAWWSKRSRQAQTMKHNTNAVYGFLELYRVTKEPWLLQAIEEWVAAVPHLQNSEGYVYFTAWPTRSGWQGDRVELVPNVGVLDLLCDLAWYLKSEQALSSARALGRKLLELQDRQTGLVRRSPTKEKTHLDAQTDLIIAWEKLCELTQESMYGDAAKKLFQAVRTYHRYGEGYAASCNAQTGEVIDYLYFTRYNSLFLKPYLRYLAPGPLYANEPLLQLLKDR